MNEIVRANRAAWQRAAQKYVREHAEHLRAARTMSSLAPLEVEQLAPVLRAAPFVVHPQSGHGLDDVALVAEGARAVVGVDFSEVTAGAAQRRADALGVPCRYVVAEVPGIPLADGCADLVYTGKGAIGWLPDIDAWAADVARLVRPGGHLFVYEAHPAAPLWTWDADEPRVRPDRGYFEGAFENDSFPANGAVQFQRTLGDIVTAVVAAGFGLRQLAEYPEPFYLHGGYAAAAWAGRLPNAFSLLAVRH